PTKCVKAECNTEVVGGTGPIVERYKRNEASLHVHYLDLIAKDDVLPGLHVCAVIDAIGLTDKPTGQRGIRDSGLDGADVHNERTMFVGIAEHLQNGEPMRVTPILSLV